MSDDKFYDVSVLTPDGWKTFTELLPCGFRFRRGQFFVAEGGYVQIKPREGGYVRASTYYIVAESKPSFTRVL